MCGIAGIVNRVSGAAPDRAQVRGMIETMHHRGPDGFGFYADADVALAHARLSIIDLAGGGQPIHNEDESVWVVFNGEIFNYIELRQQLECAGHRFYTDSDTEVIVHAYEEYGDDCLHRLNGQFAIAIWDKRARRLLLARDRAGIRPVFHTLVGGRLLFASEVKALLRHPDVPRRLNTAALGEIFTYWSTLPSHTAFTGVQALAPGHCLILQDGRVEVRRYWDWTFPTHPIRADRSEDDYAAALHELLVDAVRLQLRADVPVGAYLSGGLDSSVITAMIKRYTDTSLRTFSIMFEDAEFDESAYQRQLVAHLDTTHTAVRCTRADIRDALPRMLWHAETPVVRVAPVPLMLLSQAVRNAGYKVVLTGEGADEVLGGYDLFKEAKIRRFWARQPHSKFRSAILGRLYPYLKHSPAATRAFRDEFFRQGFEHIDRPFFAHIPRWNTTRRIWQFFAPEVRQTLGASDDYSAIESTLPHGMQDWPALGRDQYIEAHTLLSGYLLSSQGDRMAMANSVEGRFPFLDHRVIEFANRLPPQYKIRGLTEKYLLKRATRGLVPDAIRLRTKQPYRAPDAESFFDRGRPADYVDDLFAETRLRDIGLFDVGAVRKLFEKCRSGRAIGFADNMAFIGILSTLLVDALFVRQVPLISRPQTVAVNG